MEGVVFDSTLAGPLPGARVFLSGTGYAAASDGEGRFRLEGVPPGTYALSFSHPRLDTLAHTPEPVDAQVGDGTTTRVALAVPSRSSVLTAACRDSTGAVLFGTVRNRANGVPLAAAQVAVSWPDPSAPGGRRRVDRETDAVGRYLFCALPAGAPLRVGGEFVSQQLPGSSISLAAGSPREHTIEAEVSTRVRVAGRTIRASAGLQPVRVFGRVQRHDGSRPAAGTVVRLRVERPSGAAAPEVREERLGSGGEFSFARVAPGEYRLEVLDVEQGAGSQRLAVGGGGDVEVDLRLGKGGGMGSVALDPLVVTGRMERRGHTRIGRAQIEERMAKRTTYVLEMLRLRPELVVTRDCVGLSAQNVHFHRRGLRQACRPMTIYLDDLAIERPMAALRTLELERVERIEILTPAAAGRLLPGTGEGGVLMVYTRRYDAEASRPQADTTRTVSSDGG